MMILSTNPEWGDRPTYVGTLEYYSVALLASLGIGSERLAGVGPPSPQWPYDTWVEEVAMIVLYVYIYDNASLSVTARHHRVNTIIVTSFNHVSCVYIYIFLKHLKSG
jgi:hypothetical protein